MKTYLVTGGAGFIGTNFVKYMLEIYGPEIQLLVLDKLTYAGKKENLEKEIASGEIIFIEGDICDRDCVNSIFADYSIDYVINFAAESHVDRSIKNPRLFLETNILGTHTLLEAAKQAWTIGVDEQGYPKYREGKKYLQISTDEVYGSLERDFEEAKEMRLEEEVQKIMKGREIIHSFGKSFFTEESPLNPSSPYSASKASADMIVKSYYETYRLPVNITRCSNNYGPYQFSEKLIPLMIQNIVRGEKLPVYGDGMNVRDWLYVRDHNKAVDLVIQKGKVGEIYNIGAYCEKTNIALVKTILSIVSKHLEENSTYRDKFSVMLENINEKLIQYVSDRLGHDKRYAINSNKIMKELGWYPETSWEEGVEKTIQWYLENL